MAQCMECGVRMHVTDAQTHICVPSEVPQKGEVFEPTATKVSK
jgi:hypothetical protein